MSGAADVLAVNVAVAGLFAVGHAFFALSHASRRRALAFTLSYLLGMASPAVEFFVAGSSRPELLEWLAYGSFLGAILAIAAAFTYYHRGPVPAAHLLLLLWIGVSVRAVTWSLPRDTLLYGMAYQAPFAAAAAAVMASILKAPGRNPMHLLLTGVFGLLAANFLTKPFILAAMGSGGVRDYLGSTYALVSQASTGVLLLAAGAVLLILVLQKAADDQRRSAEIEPSSGLLTPAGFVRRGGDALARCATNGLPVCAVAFNLDRLGRSADQRGDPTGDTAVAAFALHLAAATPPGTILGRVGDEAFAALLEGCDAAAARLAAEGVRAGLVRALPDGHPLVTVSAGVAEQRTEEPLTSLLDRAEQAACSAKRAGGNRVCVADRATTRHLGMTRVA